MKHDVLYKLNDRNDNKVMPRTVTVNADNDLETELKNKLATRYETNPQNVELVAY